MDEQWYWCLEHERAEPSAQACRAEVRLGPYESAAAAARWKDRVDARNEAWDTDDERWEGEPPA